MFPSGLRGGSNKYLEERTEGAEELWEVPALQQRRLELERDGEQTDDHVRQCQVGDEEVCHRL